MSSMIKPPIAVDAGNKKHEIGRQKSTVSARSRSRSVGKPKLDSSLDKPPFRSGTRIDKERHDGDLPSRKQSTTSSFKSVTGIGSQVSRQRSRSLGKPKMESKLPFKSSIKLKDETRDWGLPSRKQSTTSSYKSAVKLNETRDWDVPSRKQSTTSSQILSRQRSRSLGKPKESSSVKLPLKSSIKLNEARDGDLPSRKSSATSNRVKRFSSQSSVPDDTRSLASTTENVIYDTKYRPLRTSSFTGYKSSTVLHKVSSSRLASVSSRYSRLSTAVDPRSIRKPKTSQYKVGDVQTYKLHDELETTDEEAFDSEFTDEADEAEDAPDEEAGGAEGAAPGNPQGQAGEQTGEGGPGDESGGGGGEPVVMTGDKILLQFLVLAVICKAVSLFFQPNKCSC